MIQWQVVVAVGLGCLVVGLLLGATWISSLDDDALETDYYDDEDESADKPRWME